MNPDYFQFDTLDLEEVVTLVGQTRYIVDRDGYRLRVHHKRLKTFTVHGCTCKACGRVGSTFKAETGIQEPALLRWYFDPLNNRVPIAHINLYGFDPNGEMFMMTSDHVVPRSLGGSDGLGNRIPLCETCNRKKGNDIDWLKDLPKDRAGKLVHRPSKQIAGAKKQRQREEYHA